RRTGNGLQPAQLVGGAGFVVREAGQRTVVQSGAGVRPGADVQPHPGGELGRVVQRLLEEVLQQGAEPGLRRIGGERRRGGRAGQGGGREQENVAALHVC